jgi:CheY-like chemotaxis protein
MQPANSQRGKRILVVEDNDAVREVLVLLLAGEGYATSEARNGREALDRLRRGPSPDLILLDLLMPVMDGHEFRRRQLEDAVLAPVPVVILSAVAGVAEAADALGGRVYIRKPVHPRELFAAVERALLRREG